MAVHLGLNKPQPRGSINASPKGDEPLFALALRAMITAAPARSLHGLADGSDPRIALRRRRFARRVRWTAGLIGWLSASALLAAMVGGGLVGLR